MLKQILRAMTTHRTFNRTELARYLDVSESMLAQLIQDLVRKGYLKPLDPVGEDGCHSSGCRSCKAFRKASACNWSDEDAVPKRWVLTEKGRAAVTAHEL